MKFKSNETRIKTALTSDTKQLETRMPATNSLKRKDFELDLNISIKLSQHRPEILTSNIIIPFARKNNTSFPVYVQNPLLITTYKIWRPRNLIECCKM